jgi:hypothetical protein
VPAHRDPRFGERVDTEHRSVAEVAGHILHALARDPGAPPGTRSTLS